MDEFVPLCPISFHLGHGHSIRFVYSVVLLDGKDACFAGEPDGLCASPSATDFGVCNSLYLYQSTH